MGTLFDAEKERNCCESARRASARALTANPAIAWQSKRGYFKYGSIEINIYFRIILSLKFRLQSSNKESIC